MKMYTAVCKTGNEPDRNAHGEVKDSDPPITVVA